GWGRGAAGWRRIPPGLPPPTAPQPAGGGGAPASPIPCGGRRSAVGWERPPRTGWGTSRRSFREGPSVLQVRGEARVEQLVEHRLHVYVGLDLTGGLQRLAGAEDRLVLRVTELRRREARPVQLRLGDLDRQVGGLGEDLGQLVWVLQSPLPGPLVGGDHPLDQLGVLGGELLVDVEDPPRVQ